MIPSLPANLEAELVAQPPDRLFDIFVDKLGDHGRRWHRPIEAIARPVIGRTHGLIFTALSRFEDQFARADARRNARRLLDAAAELLAADPFTGLEQVAAHANVSRTTLYHHFPSREALLDALTDRSVTEVCAALESARPTEGAAAEAMERALKTTWQVVGRYRGLVLINPRRMGRDDLRRRLEPALKQVRALIVRGQRSGAFDHELSPDWLLGLLTDMIHAASGQVSAGTMDATTAERALLRSASAVLRAHR
jgi:AcrR family transcriptional regulator